MATLVLSTVGTALGGPIGSAIGALIGQSIDQELLAPARRGPRVGDLSVQTSSYGTQIARIYGTIRVAGSVVWSTDLIEHPNTEGAKGKPDVTYSYTVSLAVALSSRGAQSVKRIWADGKLVRGAAGDFKVGTKFRFYDGSEDQLVDPLIASAEGLADTPAYRGIALAVFEDLELAEFGNRIPFLTFELEADYEAPAVGKVLTDVSAGAISCDGDQVISGYAAYGDSIRHAAEPLVETFGIDLFDDGTVVRSPIAAAAIGISDEELGNSADAEAAPRMRREQLSARSVPSVVRLAYYDPARDYQTGEARAFVGETGGNEAQQQLAAVLTAADAKSLAQRVLVRAWAKREKLTLHLPPNRLSLEPGTSVILAMSPSTWIVQKATLDGFVIVADLRPATSVEFSVAGDSGRIAPNSDMIAGPVSIALLDIPGLSPNSPTLLLAASSATAGWKRALVDLSSAGQTIAVRTAARKSLLGSAVTVLPPADPSVIDTANSVDVQLIDEDQWLTSCDDTALDAGANLALMGGELIQFGDATALGSGRFRLGRLLRGRSGTAAAVSSHAIGEVFCVIETASLQSIQLPISAIGKEVTAEIPGGQSVSLTVSQRGEPISSPSGGATVDQEARSSIDQILATLRQNGLIAN